MTNTKRSSDLFLKRMFDDEINFLARSEEQRRVWSAAQGYECQEFLMSAISKWSTLQMNRRECRLSEKHFEMMKKLYEMLEELLNSESYPKKPSEYQVLLTRSDWKQIQQYAAEVHRSIYPYLPA